jgi:hypothetical protein
MSTKRLVNSDDLPTSDGQLLDQSRKQSDKSHEIEHQSLAAKIRAFSYAPAVWRLRLLDYYFLRVVLANDLWGIENASSRLVDRWRQKGIDTIMEKLVEASGVIVDTILNSSYLVLDRDERPDSPTQSETIIDSSS